MGAERRLYEESLGMMTDFLADEDVDFGVQAFDLLQRGSKLFALYRSGRALLRPDEAAPKRTAYLDAAIASVYRHLLSVVEMETEDGGFSSSSLFWRKLVCDAGREIESVEHVPDVTSESTSEWDSVVECLSEDVLCDRDFEIEGYLDAEPETARALKHDMGIPADYYTAVPFDPPRRPAQSLR